MIFGDVTVGLVELPEIGLYDPLGSNRATVRKGSALISKQVLMASLEAGGFDVRLYNMKHGDDEEPYGEVVWKGVALTKVSLGRKIKSIDPDDCQVWGLTSNFSQHRNVACLLIEHLKSKGRPVVVGGSDAIAESEVYLRAEVGGSQLGGHRRLDRKDATGAALGGVVCRRTPGFASRATNRAARVGPPLARGGTTDPGDRVLELSFPRRVGADRIRVHRHRL